MGNAATVVLKHSRKIRWVVFILLLGIGLVQPIRLLIQNKETYFSHEYLSSYNHYQSAYYSSQYVRKVNPGIMPDESLETFAAGAFLKGVNPILIVHDQPPLGRYILAVSILLFNNVNTIMIGILAMAIIGLFLVAYEVFHNIILSVIPVILFMNEPLFLSKIIYSPLLEPIQLPFIIFAIYCYIKAFSSKKFIPWFVFAAILMGFVISTRFFVLGLFLGLGITIFVVSRKKIDNPAVYFFITIPIALLVLLASYFRTIQLGSSILHIFGIQKYIYLYHKSALTQLFTFWDLLFFNRWHTWWAGNKILSDPQWNIIWPIAMIASISLPVISAVKRLPLSESSKIILCWILSYALLLSIGYTSTRYFLPLLPFTYIIGLQSLLLIIKKK